MKYALEKLEGHLIILEEIRGIWTPTMERGKEGSRPSLPLGLRDQHYGVIEISDEVLRERLNDMRKKKEQREVRWGREIQWRGVSGRNSGENKVYLEGARSHFLLPSCTKNFCFIAFGPPQKITIILQTPLS